MPNFSPSSQMASGTNIMLTTPSLDDLLRLWQMVGLNVEHTYMCFVITVIKHAKIFLFCLFLQFIECSLTTQKENKLLFNF